MTAGLLVFMAWYSNNSKRDKILCRFRRVNKTLIAKWVKAKSRYVIFDGGKYDIITSRIVLQWYTAGIVHMLFPQWVATLDFSYNSRFPHDPNNLKNNAETPETRNALNKEEWVKSYYRGATPVQSNRKKSIMEQYAPYIAILLVVLVAFYFYNQFQGVSYALNDLAGRISQIQK
jgi:hypothetical protein